MALPKEYAGFLGQPTRPLTSEEIQIIMNLTFASFDDLQEMRQQIEKAQAPSYAILSGRLEYHKIEVDLRLVIFISCMCSTPGECVMWAYTLKCIRDRDGEVTFDNFMTHHFGSGLPSDETISAVWNAQKLSSEERNEDQGERCGFSQDNWLDYLETWS